MRVIWAICRTIYAQNQAPWSEKCQVLSDWIIAIPIVMDTVLRRRRLVAGSSRVSYWTFPTTMFATRVSSPSPSLLLPRPSRIISKSRFATVLRPRWRNNLLFHITSNHLITSLFPIWALAWRYWPGDEQLLSTDSFPFMLGLVAIENLRSLFWRVMCRSSLHMHSCTRFGNFECNLCGCNLFYFVLTIR